MKCECGKELKEGVKFCSSCGSKTKKKKSSIPIIIGIVGIIILVAFIAVIIILNILSKTNTKEDYEKFEENLESAAANYILKNKYELEEGSESNVIISDLKNDNLIMDDLTNKCEGYVLIEAEYDEYGDDDYDYDAYIACKNYKTKSYDDKYAKESSISGVKVKNEVPITNYYTDKQNCSKYIDYINKEIVSKYKFNENYDFVEDNVKYTRTHNLTISMYPNNIFKEEDSDGLAVHSAYGIYEIDENTLKLTYTFNIDKNNNGYECRTYTKPYTVDEFTINSDESISTMENYFGNKVTYPIILKKIK